MNSLLPLVVVVLCGVQAQQQRFGVLHVMQTCLVVLFSSALHCIGHTTVVYVVVTFPQPFCFTPQFVARMQTFLFNGIHKSVGNGPIRPAVGVFTASEPV